jgi:hypothetical protein
MPTSALGTGPQWLGELPLVAEVVVELAVELSFEDPFVLSEELFPLLSVFAVEPFDDLEDDRLSVL